MKNRWNSAQRRRGLLGKVNALGSAARRSHKRGWSERDEEAAEGGLEPECFPYATAVTDERARTAEDVAESVAAAVVTLGVEEWQPGAERCESFSVLLQELGVPRARIGALPVALI